MIELAEARVWARDYAFAARQHVASWFRSGPAVPLGPPGARVHVLMLPGVYEPWRFVEPLARRVAFAGNAVHFVPALGTNVRPIGESARIVLDAVDRVAEAAPWARIVLVGHSKGGLIGKRALVDRALDPEKPQPAGLVALATPFGGSRRAELLRGAVIRELRVSSETLLALAAERAADARIVAILPAIDPHVPDNVAPEGVEEVRLRAAGHFRPIATREGADAVIDAVRRLAGAQSGAAQR